MGATVVSDKAGVGHREGDVEVLRADVVDDLVVRALQERGVDGADRLEALCRQAGGEGDGVRLGDTHVEEAVGEACAELGEIGAGGHGRRDGHDARIALGQRAQRLGEDGAVGRCGRLLRAHGGDPVILLVVLFRRVPALALGRHDVQQHGAAQ